jgi:8-oxo-dGTP pyrophosphatase MutT (NUDIX family)
MLKSIREQLPLEMRRTLKSPLHQAAVLLTLTDDVLQPEIWLGVRSQQMPTHRGEVALPGGKRSEQDESLIDTALRESQEETQLQPKEVEVLGCSHTVISRRGFVVTPVIGIIPKETQLIPDGYEMTDLFKVPVDFFMDKRPEMESISHWILPRWQYDQYPIWGVTAAIIAEFLNAVRLADIPVSALV